MMLQKVLSFSVTTSTAAVATEPAYRSVVIIGSDRSVRRALPASKDRVRPQWVVRHSPGDQWGNLSQLGNETAAVPIPPPPPSPLRTQTIVLGRRPKRVNDSHDEVDRKAVPAMVSLLEGRVNVAAQVHN